MEPSTNGHRPDDAEPAPVEDNPNGLAAFDTLMAFLQADGWHPQKLEDRFMCRMSYGGSSGDIRCYAQVRVNLEQFMFYALSPMKVPEPLIGAASEFLTRANYGLQIGNFELDHTNGEVRYKSALDFESDTLTPALIKNAIYPAVQTLDRYMPGLMAVVYGGKTPLEAIAQVEGE